MPSKPKKTAALIGCRVRLLKNGRSQAVRIPRAWELPGSEAVIRKDGDRLIVSPAPKKSLLAALRQLGPLPAKDRMVPPRSRGKLLRDTRAILKTRDMKVEA